MAAVFNDVSRLDLVIPHGADLAGPNGLTITAVDSAGTPVNLSSGWTASLKIAYTYNSSPLVDITHVASGNGSITLGNGFVTIKIKSAALSGYSTFDTGVYTLDLLHASGAWRMLTGVVRLARRIS